MARGKENPATGALAKVNLFAGLSTKQLAVIAEACREEHFAEGETIVRNGDTSARFYLIIGGSADVTANGRKRATLGPGDYFGELAVLDQGPRSATVVATSATTAMSLAPFNLRAALHDNPEITLRMLTSMCGRLRLAEKAVTS